MMDVISVKELEKTTGEINVVFVLVKGKLGAKIVRPVMVRKEY